MQNNKRLLLRGLAFLIVLGLIVWGLQGIFGLDSIRSYENERGYLREDDGALDAVYVGGSDVHAFWQPLFGWNERGIAVWNYSIDSLPSAAVKYLVIEARKTQPQALIIISLSTFKKAGTEGGMVDIHRIVDYQPFSANKVHVVDRLTEGTEYTGLDKLEFYFPIIRFHSRWNSLGDWVFGGLDTDYKASMHTSTFRNTVADLSKKLKLSDERGELPEEVEAVLNELLDYCDAEQVRVLFVKAPQAASQADQARMNAAEELVTARGYPCLDLLEHYEDLGLDLQYDFYNNYHTNVHGSLKYSRWLADYLCEHYGFSDKRGEAGWESWDSSAAEYMEWMRSVTLPLETEDTARDFGISAPVLSKPKAKGRTITLRWTASEEAERYEIYRLVPSGDNCWSLLAEVDAGTLSYADKDLPAETCYFYTVVPCRDTAEGRVRGNFNVKGLSATTGG